MIHEKRHLLSQGLISKKSSQNRGIESKREKVREKKLTSDSNRGEKGPEKHVGTAFTAQRIIRSWKQRRIHHCEWWILRGMEDSIELSEPINKLNSTNRY